MLASPQRIIAGGRAARPRGPAEPAVYLDVPDAPMPAATPTRSSTTIADWTKTKSNLGTPANRDRERGPVGRRRGRTPIRAPPRPAPARRPARHAAPAPRTAVRAAPARRAGTTTPRPQRRPGAAAARRSGCASSRCSLVDACSPSPRIGVRLFELQARDSSHLVVARPRPAGPHRRARRRARQHLRPQRRDPRGLGAADDDRRRPAGDQGPGRVRGEARADRRVDQAALAERLSNHDERVRLRRPQGRRPGRRPRSAGARPRRHLVPCRVEALLPVGRLAAPVLGFVGTDNNGLGGIEYHFDELLTGTARQRAGRARPAGQRHPRRRAAGDAGRARARTSCSRIDQSLQCKTEQVLTAEVAATNAKGGIAIDRRRADRRRARDGDGRRRDRRSPGARAADCDGAATGRSPTSYEPGSTNKVITMAGAIEEGLVTPDTVFDDVVPVDPGRRHRVRGRRGARVDDDRRRHPRAVVERRHDQDRATARQGALRPATCDAFGFGQPTALGLPGESPGSSLAARRVQRHEHGVDADRQRHRGHAMQMLDVYMTIANGGIARPPRLVAATIDADGKRHDQPLPVPHQVVSPATADAGRRHARRRWSTRRDRREGADPGYTVAGKTGTARKAPVRAPARTSTSRRSPGSRPADSPRPRGHRRDRRAAGGSYLRRRRRRARVPPDHAVRAHLRAGADRHVTARQRRSRRPMTQRPVTWRPVP